MQYAKPAAILQMYERYLDTLAGSDDMLRLILRVNGRGGCWLLRCKLMCWSGEEMPHLPPPPVQPPAPPDLQPALGS